MRFNFSHPIRVKKVSHTIYFSFKITNNLILEQKKGYGDPYLNCSLSFVHFIAFQTARISLLKKRQYTHNVTTRRVHVSIFATKKQEGLHILSVCL